MNFQDNEKKEFSIKTLPISVARELQKFVKSKTFLIANKPKASVDKPIFPI